MITPSNSTTYTDTVAEVDTTTDTAVARTGHSFKTELDFGFASAPALSQQSFFVAASDPAFQAAIAAAVSTLLVGGAVSTTGSKLISSTTSSKTEQQTVKTGRSSTTSINTGRYVGPAVLTFDDRGICQSRTLVNTSPGLDNGTSPSNTYPLFLGCTGGSPNKNTIEFGDINYDTISLTNTAITITTTTTNLLFENYRIDGVSPRAVTVPEPWSAAVLAAGLRHSGARGTGASDRRAG